MSVRTSDFHRLLTKEEVISRCDFFKTVGLWPFTFDNVLNPTGWLSNFTDDEQQFAVHLLSSFMYYSDSMTDSLFVSAFNALSQEIISTKKNYLLAEAEWARFKNELIICRVTGEEPNDSDSGYLFVRKARQLLGISERNILSPEIALDALLIQNDRPIMFVDDFVGSGQQFLATWTRNYLVETSNTTVSFKFLSNALSGLNAFYCPLFCSEYGYNILKTQCPELKVRPAHILNSQYSALSHDSIIWPPSLKADAVDFVKKSSLRAGIPDNNGDEDWRGFHQLGLTLAFQHSIPDATLPIFCWDDNGWIPLRRRL